MPKYVKKALDRLQHPKPKISQYDPHRWTVPTYGKRLQMAPYPDNSEILDYKATNKIKSIVGNMIYYDLSVDPTMLQAFIEML